MFGVSCWCGVLGFELVGWCLMFRSDCKVFGCISSKSEDYWCFELVDGYLGFELV
jgi:hypothetical protein